MWSGNKRHEKEYFKWRRVCVMNKRHNQIKLLQWDKDGLAIYEKRLEKGTFEELDKMQESNDILLSNLQLQLILQVILLQSVRHKKRFSINA